MTCSAKAFPTLLVGWACFGVALLFPNFVPAEATDATFLLDRADRIKTADNAEFRLILRDLEGGSAELSAEQRVRLQYLVAWLDAYDGKYESAIPRLNAVIDSAKDPVLRFRAGVTVVNALAIATQYQEGYSRLSGLLEQLPEITDAEARAQALVVAAILHNQAGQYDLGLSFANKLLAEKGTGSAMCKGGQLRLEALYKSGKLKVAGDEFRAGAATCAELNERIYENFIRTYAANLEIQQGRFAEAIKLLQDHYEAVRDTRYTRLTSEFDALLAEAYWRTDDLDRASRHAQLAVEASISNKFTKPLVDGYRVLYQVARRRGDHRSALDFHEKFAAADKGFLTEASAKAFAFQAVRQQVLEKKQQIDKLSKRNEVLLLEQKVSKSAAQTRGLYILLLLSVLAFFAMWLYITKRSQLHFMKLARRDGLTGIFNRAHFADAAESILAYCKKGEREACVVLIDLDHFKRVNDKHGHSAGDAVLRRTVQACQSHLRSIDIMGRLGGEEFGIVLPDCDPEQARELVERFRLAIADMSSGEGGVGFPVTASFGVTSSRWSSYNLRQLIIHADKALYVAKHQGRNRVQLFDPASVAPAEIVAPQAGSFDRRRA